jgi:peptidoglycan/xylan/chitin deacetylase (PgdA/CDA1 family)/sulfur carrier protein ThiS
MAGRTHRFAPGFVAPIMAGAALVASAAVLPACGGTTPHAPAPLRIVVGGSPQEVPQGTTLGALIDDLSLHPVPGRLLSVSSTVLDRRAFPGRILVNGEHEPRATRLRTGDTVTVVDGRDRTEDTTRTVVRLHGRHFGDPQHTLRRYRIRRITTRGELSGELVSVVDQPVGRGTARHQVALTFDDGPWPVQTRRVLGILARRRVEATFFMVGYLVDRYPGIARQVKRAGMTIGNHTWDHPEDPALAELTSTRLEDELSRTSDALSALGIRPTLFRPPGGSYDDDVVEAARRLAMRVVTWSVDPQDWRDRVTSRQIVHRVLGSVRAGSIVLLHDGGSNQTATIRALPKIIRGIRKMGLELVAIPTG